MQRKFREVKSMKISEIVMLDNLVTGKSEEVKFDTREVDKKSLLSKDGFIEKKINANSREIFLLLFIIEFAACALGVLELSSEKYGSVLIMLFTVFFVCESVIMLKILNAYYSEGFAEKNEQNRAFSKNYWFWFFEKRQTDFLNEIANQSQNFVEKSFFEMNKIVLKFYLTNVIAVDLCLLAITLVIATNKPDIVDVNILLLIALVSSLYLFAVRRYILKKANSMFDMKIRYKFKINSNDEIHSMVFFLQFGLNVKYLIEEQIKCSKGLTEDCFMDNISDFQSILAK